VTREGREIGIQGNPAVFALVGRIQEETHRFAIEYHRQLRGKRTRRSELDEIAGVGEKRKAALLKRFKSIHAIREADLDMLSEALPRDAALAVFRHFHPEEREIAPDRTGV
jgi:excinuclease ABC subunit C